MTDAKPPKTPLELWALATEENVAHLETCPQPHDFERFDPPKGITFIIAPGYICSVCHGIVSELAFKMYEQGRNYERSLWQ